MQTLVDASVWIPYFAGPRSPRTEWLDAALGRAFLAVADLTLVEVLRGMLEPADREAARGALLKFPVVGTGGQELALRAAAHLAELRAAGVAEPPLPQALVATACLAQGMRLLHQDPAYEVFEGRFGLEVPGYVVEG